jgi:hypothetical protein
MSFKRLDPEDFLVSADSIVSPAWSNYSSSLTSFPVSNGQIASDSGRYYNNVYNIDPDTPGNSNAEIQFAVAYGHIRGSGSQYYDNNIPGLSPSRTIYGQFINLLFGEDENASLDFGGSGGANFDFLAIVVNRARYKQAILPGSLQIRVSGQPTIYITDNSNIISTAEYTNAGRRYALGSGSFGNGVMPVGSTNGVYGYLYPDIGVIILNTVAVAGLGLNRAPDVNGDNPAKLIADLTQFYLQSEETTASDYIFCRARNAEFNYSINPSFAVSASAGTILYSDFIQNPTTYITSIGMYNDNNELLAVAKLSKPLKKDFTKEALVRVKLDF